LCWFVFGGCFTLLPHLISPVPPPQLGQRLRGSSKPIGWVMGSLGWLLIAACHVQRCGWECCRTPSCIAWCGTWCVWQALVLLNLDAKLHGQLLLMHLLCLC
jgi:hypothetical protein